MTYREALTQAMNKLAENPAVRFVGYNTAKGPRMNGTLNQVPLSRCIETPVAENLMCGIAIGLALEGYLPVLCFERMDFTLAAADGIINQMVHLSGYGLRVPIIIRVCVGTDTPLDPGAQHKQSYRDLFQYRMRFFAMAGGNDIRRFYGKKVECPTMLMEYKSYYDKEE